MQRKRFKLVKENDSVKPLHPRCTNVKTHALETRVKQPPKRSLDQCSQTAKKRRKSTEVQSKTVFENDDVQLKFGDISSHRPVSPLHRLCQEEDEGDSLQLDDFDQPPESTSTPVNGDRNLRLNNAMDNSLFNNKSWQQPPYQQQQMLSYIPFGIVPQQFQFASTIPPGYAHGIVPISVQSAVPSVGGEFPISIGFPVGYPLSRSAAMVEPYTGNYVYGPESQSSCKSSGGYATYRGSYESFDD